MNLNVKNKQVISGNDINQANGDNAIMFDPYDDSDVPENIPNAAEILDQVISILEYMNTPEMKLLRGKNQALFEQTLEEKFPQFTTNYYSIFRMLLSGEDISPLFEMLKVLSKVNNGRTSFENGEKKVGKYLTKFLPDGLIEKIQSGEIGMNDIKTVPTKK